MGLNVLPLPKIEPRFFGRPARSYTDSGFRIGILATDLLKHCNETFGLIQIISFFSSHSGDGAQTGSTRHVGHFWPIVPAPCDCEDGVFG
jgi:hypothetical protein